MEKDNKKAAQLVEAGGTEQNQDFLYSPDEDNFLSKEGELECFKDIKSQVVKLLYMIESEKEGKNDISLWFFSFMHELASSNSLCHNQLTKVVVKIHGLYQDEKYKTMTHAQIKRQIMESRGILDHLIKKTTEELKSK